jgi:putative hydrolase of the HAD superfamily
MAIRAVVFDVGNVLELTEDNYPFDEWAASLGLTSEQFAQRTAGVFAGGDVGTITLDEVHESLGEALAIGAGQVSTFMEGFWREYLGVPNVALIEWARTLRPRYTTGILSNSFVGAREREHEAYGYGDLVDDLVYSHEVGMLKPDPRIYALSCDRLGVLPEEAVFLDDKPPYVAGAREAGLHAVHFRGDNTHAIAEIEKLLSTPRVVGSAQKG